MQKRSACLYCRPIAFVLHVYIRMHTPWRESAVIPEVDSGSEMAHEEHRVSLCVSVESHGVTGGDSKKGVRREIRVRIR